MHAHCSNSKVLRENSQVSKIMLDSLPKDCTSALSVPPGLLRCVQPSPQSHTQCLLQHSTNLFYQQPAALLACSSASHHALRCKLLRHSVGFAYGGCMLSAAVTACF